MRFHGTYRDGVIKPVGELPLPDGSEVDFDLHVEQEASQNSKSPPSETPNSFGRLMLELAGSADDPILLTDGAYNLDHYRYGTPKRRDEE